MESGCRAQEHIVTTEKMTWDVCKVEEETETVKRQSIFKSGPLQSGPTYLLGTEGTVPRAYDTYNDP